MRVETPEAISSWLERSGALSEALMKELCLVNHGYSVHMEFSVIVDPDGRVLEEPLDVGVDLDGVQQFALTGGLTTAMLEHPEEIGWGLSEVAQVRVASADVGVRFEALWEGARRIEIHCRRATLTVPAGHP